MKFLFKKVLQGVAIMLGVVTILFIIFYVVLPADTARLTVGQRSDAKTLENIKKELYLDKPVITQYVLYLNDLSPLSIYDNIILEEKNINAVHLLSLGINKSLVLKLPYLRRSYHTKKQVNEMLVESFPGTAILAIIAICIATFIGILLGIIAAIKQNTWIDTSAIFAAVMGISLPSFFAAILIAYIFGFLFSHYTGLSIISPMWDYDPFTGKHFLWKSLILPVFTLALRPMAVIMQITRSAMLDVLNQDFIRTAYAKGLSKKQVVIRHALPNALNPVITSISGWFAELLAGSFFIEYIFGWKGIGKISVDALNRFDFPVVMGAVLFTSFIIIIINIISDMSYKILDPRVK